MTTDAIALQLYTVRDLVSHDYIGALRQVADAGYRAVELAGTAGMAPADLRAALDAVGLRAVSAHVRLDDLRRPAQELLAQLEPLGCSYAALAWLPPEERGSVDGARRLAGLLNRCARTFQTSGIRFGYHNHDFEFAPLGSTTMFELLAAETDPDLVFFELDVYWAQFAGMDPAELIRRYAGRMPLLHMKDMRAGDRSFAPVGTGVLDWPAIVEAARAAGTEWFIVEQDTSDRPLDDVRTSLHNLRLFLS
ncbi:MAG: sugar phosphate isomerase/epimerase [Chloroflexi bacterium]|nr:sugar phosphate isomerase/epimerase [Chloroflexota bacterium]